MQVHAAAPPARNCLRARASDPANRRLRLPRASNLLYNPRSARQTRPADPRAPRTAPRTAPLTRAARQAVRDRFGIDDPVPKACKAGEWQRELLIWLGMAATRGRMVIFLDGLDQAPPYLYVWPLRPLDHCLTAATGLTAMGARAWE